MSKLRTLSFIKIKNLILTISLLSSSSLFAAVNNIDSCIMKRNKKHSFEIGYNTIKMLASKYRKKGFYNDSPPLPIIGIAYKNSINEDYKIGISFFTFGYFDDRELKLKKRFDIDECVFIHLSGGLYKKLIEYKWVSCFAKASLNWRFGEEQVYLEDFRVTVMSRMNGIGPGIGIDSYLKIRDKITLGIDFNYIHYFEKPDPMVKYNKPARDMLMANFKLGVLF